MENLATHWILTLGMDCDGFVKNQVMAFSNESEAYSTALDLSKWSDGLQYNVTNSLNDVKEYCIDFDLELKDYLLLQKTI